MINKLKKLKVTAMKERNTIAKNILSLLHSNALVMAKKETRDMTDTDIIKSAKSLIKKNQQSIDIISKAGFASTLEEEQRILKEFLPKQMTEAEIEFELNIICGRMEEDDLVKKNQGNIMKQIKEKFGDSINMGIASKFVASKLK